MKVNPVPIENLIDEAIKIGRQEVVEWIDKTFSKAITLDQMRATMTYQKQLKEWGINKED